MVDEHHPSEGSMPMMDVIFLFDRMPVGSDDEWKKVQEKGRAGWDIITVSGGFAYMRSVVLDVEEQEQEETIEGFCGVCRYYRGMGEQKGSCHKHGRFVGRKHRPCNEFKYR